jgi:hypothetical protein
MGRRGRREEAAVEDRVAGLVGHKVAVRLTNVEAGSLEILAVLAEVRDDGIVLSEIGELGPGPTMFCPWDSLRRVRERPPWLRSPYDEPGPVEAPLEREFYELREATAEELAPERPVAQRQTVGEITVAITSLELFGEGVGVLRYRISYDGGTFYRLPEPELISRDGSGRDLPWSPQGSSGNEREADGEVGVRDLPDVGEVEVVVTRLVALVFDEESREEVVEDSTAAPGPSGSLSNAAPRYPAGSFLPGAFARLGQDEQQGEDDYQDEAGRDVDEREREGDEVGDHPEHIAPGHHPEQGGIQISVHEAVTRGGVEPEEGEEDGGYGQGASVDGPGRGPLRARTLQVVGEQGGGEGDESHAHQKQDVEEEQEVVRTRDKAEAVVMVGPDNPDLQEADRVPEIRRPLLDERPEEGCSFGPILHVRHPDLYHE